MAGIKNEDLCVLCFLSIVITLGVVLAVPVTALRQESSTAAPDVIDSRRKGPPLQDSKVGRRGMRAEGQSDEDDKSSEYDGHAEYDGQAEYYDGPGDDVEPGEGTSKAPDDDDDFDEGIVEGDGGCDHIEGEYTTARAGYLLASGSVLFLPIYMLVNQLLL